MSGDEPRIYRPCGKGQVQGSSGALDLIRGHPHLTAFLKPNRCRWMLKDHHSPRDPRLATRQHHAPLTASCNAPNELAICRSGGCRVVRAGRGAEIAPNRSASSPTREVLRNTARLPVSPDVIHWRQRPGIGGLRCIRSSRPARTTRHHPMLEAFYRRENPGWYYEIVIPEPITEASTQSGNVSFYIYPRFPRTSAAKNGFRFAL